MPRFNDALNAFGDEIPEKLQEALINAYDEDVSIPTAKVAELEAEKSELLRKQQELKAQNFDLFRFGGGNPAGKQNDDGASQEPELDKPPRKYHPFGPVE